MDACADGTAAFMWHRRHFELELKTFGGGRRLGSWSGTRPIRIRPAASVRVAYSTAHTALPEHRKGGAGMTRRLLVGLTVMRYHGAHGCVVLEASILFYGSENYQET